MNRPFLVPVGKMRRAPGTRHHEVRRGVLDDLAGTGSAVPEGAECEADVSLEAVQGGVEVVGTVSAPWRGQCRRCLATAEGVLRIPVRELYTPGGDGEETYPLSDDTVDLEPLVHDAVLLELPVAPLCAAACRGLCPTCGANRNEGDCGCTAPPDPRWAALDVLRVPDPETGGGAPGG